MSDAEAIQLEVEATGIKLDGEPVQDATEVNKYYVFIPVAYSREGVKRPSPSKLHSLSKRFQEKNLDVTFILVERERRDIETSIKAALFRFFSDLVKNAYIEFAGHNVTIWIEPKKPFSRDDVDRITTKMKELLQALGEHLEAIRITSTENLPTRTACLNLLRLKSPITLEDLQIALEGKNFHIPSKDWLSKMLDNLRKANLVIRKKDEKYVLTLSGLLALGSMKNRNSPDVVRALDIAKRGT